MTEQAKLLEDIWCRLLDKLHLEKKMYRQITDISFTISDYDTNPHVVTVISIGRYIGRILGFWVPKVKHAVFCNNKYSIQNEQND